MASSHESGAIGRSAPRREDTRLLSGRGRFVADVVLPRMLEASFVRSHQPHALITRIATEAAVHTAGVERVVTAADLPPVTMSTSRHPGLLPTPQPVLAVDRVRFVGEPVAMVLARDRYVAEDAAELVSVDYEPLPCAIDPGDAEVPLFEDIPDNVVFQQRQTYGEVAAAFGAAACVVSRKVRFPRQLACPLEPRGCVADFDPASRALTVWASTQAPHRLRRDLALAVGIPETSIRVMMIDIGGAFGQKIPTHLEEIAVVLAAMATGRPVRWIEDRTENLTAAPHSRDQSVSLELAADADGLLTALRARIVGDAGAYSFNSASPLTEGYRTARAMPGPYRLSNYEYELSIHLTNKAPIAPYRGVGFVAAQCARELLIDDLARELGLDRFEIRRRNLVSSAELPYTSCTGWEFGDVSFIETLDAAEELLTSRPDTPPSGRLRGIGISPYVEPSGVGAAGAEQVHGVAAPSFDAARVSLDPDGGVTVHVGTPSFGQGLETTLAQVAADALGVDLETVAVRWSDTSAAPISWTGSRASRAAVVSGGAVGLAAEDLKAVLVEVAADLLEAAPGDLEIREGSIWVQGETTPRLELADVARAAYVGGRGSARSGPLEFTRTYDPPATYSNACVMAVVDVETATGRVEIQRIVAAEDCGRMINPKIVEGQFVGALAQAIGSSLFEQVVYRDGQPLTSTMLDYLLPTASDTVPVEFTHVGSGTAQTWGGIKGMGESGVIGGVAAVVAAVADALAQQGARVSELPLLPSTVWTLLDQAMDVPPDPSVTTPAACT